MSIRRFGATSEHGPLISRGVIHNGTLFLSGVTASDLTGDVATQTREALHIIDGLLTEAGTNKDNVLTVHIWLADMARFQDMNAAWNDWVDAAKPPARTCVSGELYRPDCLVEIAVTAVIEG
jgi:enamine deaminase RidA (YjgF/YER057c/UK114 family)